MKQPNAFWITTRELFRYRRTLAVAFAAAVVAAVCYGAGISLVLPILTLFFDQELFDQGRHPLRELIANNLPEAWATAINGVVPDDIYHCLLLTLGVLLSLTLVGGTCRYIHTYLTITAVEHGALRWRDRLFARVIDTPLGRFQTHEAADAASRIVNDTNVLSRGHMAILGKAAMEALKGLAALTMAIVLDWRLTMIFLVAAVAIIFTLRKIGKIIRRASRGALQEQGHLLKVLTGALGSMPAIKAANASGHTRRRFRVVNRSFYRHQMRMRRAKAMSSPLTEALGTAGVLAASCVAAWWVFRQGLPPSTVITVLAALGAAASSIKPLSGLHNQIRTADAAAHRVLEALAEPVEPLSPDARRSMPTLPPHRESVVFDQVSYSYDGREPALDHVSLEAAFGQTIAVVGGNGAGKSTLLNLLPRLLEPTTGRVLIDGVDTANVNLKALREQVAVVSQQAVTFEGTIAENIAFARPTTPMNEIQGAARLATADEFIRELPDGYNHRLGEGGSGLSGGQRQRLCIARAVLRDPRILILDEATSQVDAESEAKLNAALEAVSQGRTTFVIAHRLSTVVGADRIVVMEHGRIIDQGTHDELLSRCTLYQNLTRTQLHRAAS